MLPLSEQQFVSVSLLDMCVQKSFSLLYSTSALLFEHLVITLQSLKKLEVISNNSGKLVANTINVTPLLNMMLNT